MIKRIKYNSPVILTFTFLSYSPCISYLTRCNLPIYYFLYIEVVWQTYFLYKIIWPCISHADFYTFSIIFNYITNRSYAGGKYGSSSIAMMILITAAVTGIFNILFFKTALLGASGIAFMMILLGSFVNIEERFL